MHSRSNWVPSEKTAIGKRRTESTEAYSLYLKGRQLWNRRTRDSVDQAIECFKRAAEIDPNFALVYVGIADCYHVMDNYGWAPVAETAPKAKQSVLKALKLDGSLAEAHATYAEMLAQYDWRWEEAELEFKRSIELNPNYATTHQWYAYSVLRYARRVEEEMLEAEKALELDPLAPVMSLNKGQSLYMQERYDEAIECFNRALAIDPGFVIAAIIKAECYLEAGRHSEATALYAEYLPRLGQSENRQKLTWAWVYGKTGRAAEGRKLLEDVVATSDRAIPPTDFASAYQSLGDVNRMFEFFELAYLQRDPSLPYMLILPGMKSFQSDPRCLELKRKIGI